ncbi:MAG: phosphoenolpyruvate--protein phosphotransferase [Planctomycetota bacterium]|jgi:phosphotransferase system enzyme I (PtsI)
MKEFSGIPVSQGIAIAEAYVIEIDQALVTRRILTPDARPGEVERIEAALEKARAEVDRVRSSAHLDSDLRSIFDFHILMLEDVALLDEIKAEIETRGFSAEYAVDQVFRRKLKAIREIQDQFFASRDKDILDVERRIRRILTGDHIRDLDHVAREITLVSSDLTPSQTATLPRRWVKGLVTEAGGKTSHTALLARSMGIPAVVGIHSIVPEVNAGDLIIIDGFKGLVIVEPDDETLEEYRDVQRRFDSYEEVLRRELTSLPGETPDGYRIKLSANIEGPAETAAAVTLGAEGIGLFRTEFLWASNPNPSENDHFESYRQTISNLHGRSLTIRTFDFGADKVFRESGGMPEKNPSLGCRSIRLSFRHQDLFRTQLRAILRASALGRVKLMFPMIATLEELHRAIAFLRDVMDELESDSIPFDDELEVGAMVEVPSAALIAGTLGEELDFLSIGTNDLIQYTLAVDRVNETVADLYQPVHPAVLRLVADVVRVGEEKGIEVSMCGEMSGDIRYTVLLLGLGLKEFSVTPSAIPDVKKVIRSVTMKRAREVAHEVFSFSNAEETEEYLQEVIERLLPIDVH